MAGFFHTCAINTCKYTKYRNNLPFLDCFNRNECGSRGKNYSLSRATGWEDLQTGPSHKG